MKENSLFTNYRNLFSEELEKLPVEELAKVSYELLQKWDKLNQRLNQDSTNSHRSPSADRPGTKAKHKAGRKTTH
jgi:hypothetical protein